MRLSRLVFLCSWVAAAPLAAAPERPVRFDELAKIRRVGAFSVSPDGRRVAFALSTPDVEANRSRSAVWIVGIDGGEARRLTSGDQRDSEPSFSPVGRRLAFLSNRDGASQI